jgi:adenosine deaminase
MFVLFSILFVLFVGCVSESYLRSLIEERSSHVSIEMTRLPSHIDGSGDSLAACFRLFSAIHEVTNSIDVVQRVVNHAIEKFAEDGCFYAELRTTPRVVLDAKGESRVAWSDYVTTVVDTIRLANANDHLDIQTRLLLSINRSMSEQEAHEVVALAEKSDRDVVVGVELSGNPYEGHFRTFIPALDRARASGFPISLHFAEKLDAEESNLMMDFKPDRIGHANFLDERGRERMTSLGIPLEVCENAFSLHP